MWYEWDSMDTFNEWHDAICASLGYPITPINQKTGKFDENAEKVTSYTQPIEIDGKVIAWVEDSESTGLTETDLRPNVEKREEESLA